MSWRFNEAAARCRGKLERVVGRTPEGGEASMRPRPDAAENFLMSLPDNPGMGASMRPRPDAAENIATAETDPTAATPGFNEAAARCRGKLACPSPGRDLLRDHASMRPRPDAAENLPSGKVTPPPSALQ